MKIKDINVCTRLANERKRLKLTQSEVAKTCNVSVKTVGRWERNVAIPADKLALLIPLQYDITYILTNVKFESTDNKLSSNIQHVPTVASQEISTEQRMWLDIIKNLTSNDASQLKEFGLALLGYSQAKTLNN